jgi:hypothetical protein
MYVCLRKNGTGKFIKCRYINCSPKYNRKITGIEVKVSAHLSDHWCTLSARQNTRELKRKQASIGGAVDPLVDKDRHASAHWRYANLAQPFPHKASGTLDILNINEKKVWTLSSPLDYNTLPASGLLRKYWCLSIDKMFSSLLILYPVTK